MARATRGPGAPEGATTADTSTADPGRVLRAAIAARPVVLDVAEHPVSTPLGVTTCRPMDTALTLVGRADRAMYDAAQTGRKRVRGAEDLRVLTLG